MATLLEQAKSMKKEGRTLVPNEEELEVVLAYLNAEITARQGAAVLNMLGVGSFTHRIATVLHWALEMKLIKIKKL